MRGWIPDISGSLRFRDDRVRDGYFRKDVQEDR